MTIGNYIINIYLERVDEINVHWPLIMALLSEAFKIKLFLMYVESDNYKIWNTLSYQMSKSGI